MSFTIPNEADAFNVNQAEPDSIDFSILADGIQGDGVLSGCAVTAQGSPDMTVAVAAGTIRIGTVIVAVGSGNVTIGTADATNPRFDLITVNNSGTKACTAGTAAAQPVYPAIPANSCVLAAVYIPATDTTIATNQITDKRTTVPQSTALYGISDPAATATGSLIHYARNLSGRMIPYFVGPTNNPSAVQPSLWGKKFVMWLPGVGTTAAISIGVSWTIATTQAHPTIANTNFMTQILRATFTTTTTAANTTGIRSAAPVCWRGNAAGQGGFFFWARFGVLTYTSTMRVWVGLSALTTALAADPSATNDTVCMSKDTGETTWQVMTRDTSAASKTSTGRTTAASTTAEIFDFFAWCKPNDSQITVRVVDITSGTVLVDNVSKSSNLPTATVMLTAHAEATNVAGGAGTAVALWLGGMYIEADT